MNYCFEGLFCNTTIKKEPPNINQILKNLKMLDTNIKFDLSIYTLDIFSEIDSPKYQKILEDSITSEQPI
jgi:hypothetical protein